MVMAVFTSSLAILCQCPSKPERARTQADQLLPKPSDATLDALRRKAPGPGCVFEGRDGRMMEDGWSDHKVSLLW